MSATNETLAGQAEDLLDDLTSNPVTEYQQRGIRVRRSELTKDRVQAMAMLQALASSRRGLSVAKIENAQ